MSWVWLGQRVLLGAPGEGPRLGTGAGELSASRVGSVVTPPRQPPARPTPESRSSSRSSPCGRVDMSDLERVLCERKGYTNGKVLVGDMGASRNWKDTTGF